MTQDPQEHKPEPDQTHCPGLPEHKRLRSLRYSVVDAGFAASMVGFGESYFVPLLLFVGGGNHHVGFFTALPQLFAALSQLVGVQVVEGYSRRKRILTASAATQALALGVVLLLVLRGLLTPWAFIGLAVLFYSVNGLIIPAWNSLMGDLTKPEDRGRYFGRRNGVSQLASFGGLLLGGLVLQHYARAGNPAAGFAVALAVAMTSRLASTYALSRHFEVPYASRPDAKFTLWQFLRRSRDSNFARFVFFVALMSFAVQLASPFFIAYMLRDLGFSYIQYTLAQGIMVAAQFVAMRSFGPFSDRYGNRVVLVITGLIIPIVPLLWFFTVDFLGILVIQFLSGVFWGGWMLSTANFVFDAVTPPKRARCAAYLSFFSGFGVVAGSLLGALLSVRAPAVLDSGAVRIVFLSPLQFLFLVSALLRFVVAAAFLPYIKEVKPVHKDRPKTMLMSLIQIRPFAGARFFLFTGGKK